MKKGKRIIAAMLAVVLLPFGIKGERITVQANALLASSSSYNSDVDNLSYTTQVEDQVQSNYCWAYMANAVLESYLLKAGRGAENFSEDHLIYQMSGGNYGFTNLMQGGSFHQAVAYWTRGVQYGPCREMDNTKLDYYVSATAELGKYTRNDGQEKQTYLQNMKNLIVQYGAVGVSVYFDAATRTQTTRNGAYYYPQESSPGVNHGVTVVGWNDDYPAQWFYNSLTPSHQPNSKGAFLVKNSWGQADASSINGNTGYYWISYENYFQDAFAVSQVSERSRLYDYIYETDYWGLYDYTAGSHYSQRYYIGSNVQWLSGFATYVKAGAVYHFYANGQELSQFSGTMAQSGYRTFQLASPIAIHSTTLELRVEVESTEDAVPLAANAGNTPDAGNVCLKAFTVQAGGVSQPGTTTGSAISTVVITPQNCTLQPGQSQAFTSAVLGNGSQSQLVFWQLSGNSSSKTRLVNNVLYVGDDERSSVIYVYASSSADVTKTASAKVTIQRKPETIAYYTVTFLNEGEICKSQNVRFGESAMAPVLTKEGYRLEWDKPYNYVTTNLIVNAVWTKIGNTTDTGDENQYPGNGNGTEQGNEIVQTGIVDKGIYSCWQDGTAHYTKCTTKNRLSLRVPANVRLGGKRFLVTDLGEGCMRGNKKVHVLQIGKNVTQIGDEAFYGCKNLEKISIKSEKIESIGIDAFYHISSKAVIRVPRSRLAEYRAMVRESGNKKVRVKAYD